MYWSMTCTAAVLMQIVSNTPATRVAPLLMPAANNMFSEALALWPLCWEAWMAWGKFCDTMYDKSKEAQWLEFLATCYLQVHTMLCDRPWSPILLVGSWRPIMLHQLTTPF